MGTDGPGPLADFLRTRRGLLQPTDVGLSADASSRRVQGLRREEVAMLAGVSVDYYTRLEQGRERSPSVSVLESLAAALRLVGDARDHLFHVTGTSAPIRVPVLDRLDPALVELMAAWPDNPAIIYNRAYDVLASNPIADALFGGWQYSRNLVEIVFQDPAARTFYADWPAVAASTVAGFRLNHGLDPTHPRLRDIVSRMLAESPEFTHVWATHRVRGKSLQRKRFAHPAVGELELTMQAFDVRSSPGQALVVYHAEPGSRSAEGLTLLGTLSATTDERGTRSSR
jgi:transcriptional regulator with XRE-family HTH domain